MNSWPEILEVDFKFPPVQNAERYAHLLLLCMSIFLKQFMMLVVSNWYIKERFLLLMT